MALYRYEATDKTGKVVRGVMNARDEQQVVQNLQSMGYTAHGVYASGGAATTTATQQVPQQAVSPRATGMQSLASSAGVPVSIRSCVPVPTLALYFRQLATLVKSGMSLSQALGEMPLATRDRRLRDTIPKAQEATSAGRPLSGSMAEYPQVFPVHVIASVWSGEMAGRLEIALEEVAADLENEASELRYGRIGWGLTKIHIVILALLIPMSNLTALLLPALEEAFKHSEGVSSMQVLAFVFANYMKTMFWKSMIATGLMIAAWIAWGHIKRIPRVKRFTDGVVLAVPIWGPLHRDRALARFLHVMDGLYAAGLTPGQAWDSASLTARNSALAERLKLARNALPPDASIGDLCAASGVFDPEEVAMARSGEKTGQVPAVLANMSAIYADKAAAAKTRNKGISITLMSLFFAVLLIVVWYRVVNSYVDLAVKAAEAVGKP